MTDENMMKEPSRIVAAFLSILPKNLREYLGVWVMILAPMVLMLGLLLVISKPTEKCWDLKSTGGKVYKLNTCTGRVEELPSTKQPGAGKSK